MKLVKEIMTNEATYFSLFTAENSHSEPLALESENSIYFENFP